MARRILAFRHVPHEHLGLIADSLEAGGVEIEYADLYAGGDVDVSAADGLVFMGGPMSANDDLPYLRRELELIRAAISRGLPVLGICLGAQLIAKALGACVYPNRVRELGWLPIRWSDAAEADPLHRGLSGCDTVFHWHYETFDLPEGAVRLASSEGCLNQAFRLGSNTYGFQYHLEVTPQMIGEWLEQDSACGDSREVTEPIDQNINAARLRELAAQVFGGWRRLALESKC